MTKPVDEKRLALSAESVPKRDMPLVPRDTVAGRALVVVIAIMSFLASLTAGGALLIDQASQGWRSEVLRDVTIQIKPADGDDVEGLVAKAVSVSSRAPGVKWVHAYSAAESTKLLQPWLGDGLDLSLLPIPRMIVVRMQQRPVDDLGALREALARAVPQANLDDHRLWAARIGTMANAVVALAAVVFALMMAAMATAIGFATRGAMAENREIIEVLHLVGASDAFIAREFETHFRRLGFRGAMIGGVAAMAFFLGTATLFSWDANSTGGTEIAAMFGAFALGPAGYLALTVIGAAIALLTGFLSRAIVFRHLRGLS
jgi:cell division transport system permease protein